MASLMLEHGLRDAFQSSSKIIMFDPSELYRPDNKDYQDFRNFDDASTPDRVKVTYREMHTHQTVDYVRDRMDYWCHFNKTELTVLEALDKLNDLVDESDPDTDVPNIFHAFQTAERCRAAHPNHDWFHLTGLIHDLGKIMAMYGEPQWSTVGDTFVVGCAPAPSCVYYPESFAENADINDQRYNSKFGKYTANCGLTNVQMSWGHDEYMYRVLETNRSTLPAEGMYIVRYHSFYPWHHGGDYMHLCDERDMEMLPWIKEFNKFDLYSKSDEVPDIKVLTPYYQSLIDKYCPGKLKW